MTLQFGVFDHIEPVPGLDLEHIYAQRLVQIERLDTAGFYAYHLARAPHSSGAQPGAIAECLPGGRLPAYHASALRALRLCPTPAPPGASH